MLEQLRQGAARLHHIGGHAEHLDITLVGDDEPARSVEHQQALRHIIDGGVEALLFQLMLLRQLANREKQQGGDREHRKSGHRDQRSDLLPPIGQRRRDRRGRNDRNRKMAQYAGRGQPFLAVDGAGYAYRAVVRFRQNLLMNRTGTEIHPDHRIDVRMTRQQRAVAMVH